MPVSPGDESGEPGLELFPFSGVVVPLRSTPLGLLPELVPELEPPGADVPPEFGAIPVLLSAGLLLLGAFVLILLPFFKLSAPLLVSLSMVPLLSVVPVP